MNVLYINNPKSIHDIKWMTYFSDKKLFHCYSLGENRTNEAVEKHQITNLPSITSFSLKNFFQTIKSGFKLRSYLKKHDIHLVHVLFITPHIYWTLFTSKPFMVTSRGSDVLIVLSELFASKSIKDQLLFKLAIRQLKKASYITCTSEHQIKRLTEFGLTKDKIHLIRTGIDINRITSSFLDLPKKLVGQKFVFSPRFFSDIYNIKAQIAAINKLPDSLRNSYTFVFIEGQNPNPEYKESVLSLLEQSQFKYIIFPYLYQIQLWSTMKSADLVIMTPKSDGTPNSALEAMACKTPLIISDLNYGSPLFEDTCLKANPLNINDITEKINIALTDYPQALLDNAYKLVQLEGNRDTEMRKLELLYQSICRNK